jgi:type I restriction enzyme S subunit
MAPYLSLADQKRLKISLPPISDQRAIAKILGSLDDKIDLNRRMNETLEAMARAIFKSWFVDFDPVRAKMEGRTPPSMDPETALLFPNAFESTQSGLIPAGWRISPIGEEVCVVGGSTPSTAEPDYWGGSIPFATPKDLAGLAFPVLLETERCITEAGLDRISSGLLPRGTVLMSSRAPIGYFAITEVPLAVNQGFIAMVCDKSLPSHYVLRWTRENLELILGNANGTTFLEISKANFRPLMCLVPPRQILDCFGRLVEPLRARVVANLQESVTLATVRDTLLPKLLSGEIRVNDADTALGTLA